ncbi:hypothetical protein INS49_010479 [Diaporthe citri]|uniref:uncharacterized protein n=1 Tax=Diaporthe citri TaxID=83186 RepID=UPI001C803AAC|nr:uncharacterized protein INS49_010479 [Diaporthe citri]KAG6362249.1 hypothetical protein INS49_010479 [Diaporthe citri]
MQSIQIFMAAILMAILSLVGASATINASATIADNTAASTLTLTGGSASTTASTTTSITASTTASIIVNPTPNPKDTRNCSPCYCDGETWDQLGTWETISWALQNSGIVRVVYIPGGYHVNENIRVGDHCFVYEIGVDVGNSGDMSPARITDLLAAARGDCSHGGRWSLNFVAGDGDIIGRGWLKADPQKNKDCS